jgi:acid phosphatase (class A)
MRIELACLLLFINLTIVSCTHFSVSKTKDLLGPFPVIGSVEEKKDIDELLFYQHSRSAKQCEQAAVESNTSLKNFFGGSMGPLKEDEVTKVQKNLRLMTIKAGIQIFINKLKFNRARPYTIHPEIKPCLAKEFSKSYPSGHAAMSRIYARVLSVIFPERASQFMKRADEIALNRVIGGVHHPSDIEAGKKLGDALAEYYLSDKKFHDELVQIGH